MKKKKKKNKDAEVLKDNKTIFCSYGCGKLAKYFFSISKKFCCSTHYMKCSNSGKKYLKNV